MNYIPPTEYFVELKEILSKELQRVTTLKQFALKAQNIETASEFREIERKVQMIVDELNDVSTKNA